MKIRTKKLKRTESDLKKSTVGGVGDRRVNGDDDGRRRQDTAATGGVQLLAAAWIAEAIVTRR